MGLLKKHPVLFLGVGLTVLFLILGVLRIGILDRLDYSVYDLMMNMRTDSKSASDIVLVNIDETSLTSLGRWPWPRSVIARGLHKIKAGEPKAVGLTAILAEPEQNAGLLELNVLEKAFTQAGLASGSNGAAFLKAMNDARLRLDNDKLLSEALVSAGNVVLPLYFTRMQVRGEPSGKTHPGWLVNQALTEGVAEGGDNWEKSEKVIFPLASFAQASKGMGHITLIPDPDGVARTETPFFEYDGLLLPSFAVKLAQISLNVSKEKALVNQGESLSLGSLSVPLDPDSQVYFSFKGGAEAFESVPFSDVVNDKIQLSTFKDKIVIIAFSVPGLADFPSTPVGKLTHGEYMANALWAMQNGKFIAQPGWTGIFKLLLTIIIGLLIIFVFPKVKAGAAAGIFGGLLAALAIFSVVMFVSQGVWVRVTYPIVQLVIGYIGLTSIQYLLTQTGKEKAEGESAEVNRMLGVSFQNQGMLDMAFEKFQRVPMDDGMKKLLYNLALDYERKRQLNKAASVYEYIEEFDPKYKDVAIRKTKLMQASETMIFGQGMLGGTKSDQGILTGGSDTKPTLGRYEVVKMLGKGAMGVVYLGQDPRINRTVAIKTVRFSDDFPPDEAESMKKNFFREAESAGTLTHPNIVTIYDAGEEQDLAYIAMEFLEGDDLDKHIKPGSLLPMRKVIEYVADVADALGYAHEKGIVHRDVKPANMMLLKSGVVKVTDFGIARISASSQTATGVIKGTPFYMSPEQIAGEKVDGRSDIFSLGVMLYQLLTGELPFRGDSVAALMHQIMNVKHPDPRTYNDKIYKPLVGIIDKALEKNRDERYQKAGQMAAHLRELGKKIDQASAAQKKTP
ncbi:MAG: CHASE2 domain-containing protein [Deltaproteobacteria bacterium]|nr:CHASE2 domain-containing protein [Deltaproteobacteria bacterium]